AEVAIGVFHLMEKLLLLINQRSLATRNVEHSLRSTTQLSRTTTLNLSGGGVHRREGLGRELIDHPLRFLAPECPQGLKKTLAILVSDLAILDLQALQRNRDNLLTLCQRELLCVSSCDPLGLWRLPTRCQSTSVADTSPPRPPRQSMS